MVIQELARQESLELLARTHLGRLGCALGSQPYVVPLYFTYRDNYLYSFSTVGRKIEWMRVNPLVCIEADEVVNSQQWMSVTVFGRYEELPDTPEWKGARTLAYELLKQNYLVGAGLRQDDPSRHRPATGAGLLPHRRKGDYGPPSRSRLRNARPATLRNGYEKQL
jgi:nitroimidazol reductase NimA-like FMN-containing flavoprotein (pyridoxamine 5'-phosphate oxidase superfamily)